MRQSVYLSQLLCAAMLFGCSYGPGVPANSYAPPVFPDELRAKYAPYDQPGSGSIAGQAFLRTRGGEVRHAAGELVTAEPATEEAVRVATATGKRPPWKEIESYRRSTTADAEGLGRAASTAGAASCRRWYLGQSASAASQRLPSAASAPNSVPAESAASATRATRAAAGLTSRFPRPRRSACAHLRAGFRVSR